MSAIITFIYPIIRDDFILSSLMSLYKFTDKSKFRVIVIDQTIRGGWDINDDGMIDMVIRMKNVGFAAAANTGIRVALSWGTPYIGVINDDTEFIYPNWLEDALEEFKTDPKIIAVNPMCPKIAMWGYGMTNGEYLDILPYKDKYSEEDIKYLKTGDYNKAEIEQRHPYKIPASFPFTQRGVVDGIAGWLPIFKREGLIEQGLYDERFFPGGGEDYDWMCRAYSCGWPIPREKCDPQYHRRAVSTMRSWVYHHWGQSKDIVLDPKLFEQREGWNRLDILWDPKYNEGNSCDPWGHYHKEGKQIPLKRLPDVYIYKP